MTREMRYQSKNNSYTVKKKGKPAYSKTGFFICVILPVLIFILLTVSLFIRCTAFDTIVDSVSFNSIMPNPSYKVTIKENDKYTGTELPSDMKYVSSLIETVNPTFKYDFHATEPLDVTYDYNISYKYVMLDYSDEITPLTEDKIMEVKSEQKSEKTASFQINETVAINYQEYAQKALEYKQDLRVPAIGKLYVYMTLHISAGKDSIDKKYADTLIQEIEIPLTDAITEIKQKNVPVNKQDFLNEINKFSIRSMPMFILTIIFVVIDLGLVYRLIREYKRFKTKDLYTAIVTKVLKDYDRVIVRGKLDIDESKYNNIIYPETFEQLVDASVNEGSPILYYNVDPGKKCFFVIISGDTLYKYRITRWYVDQNGNA